MNLIDYFSDNPPYFPGLLLTIIGSYYLSIDAIRRRDGYLTSAKVVKPETGLSQKGNLLFYPVVRFKDLDGQMMERKLESGSSPPLFYEGDELQVTVHKGEVHATGKGWTLFYWLLVACGVSVSTLHWLNIL
jgi:hypothetical protein